MTASRVPMALRSTCLIKLNNDSIPYVNNAYGLDGSCLGWALISPPNIRTAASEDQLLRLCIKSLDNVLGHETDSSEEPFCSRIHNWEGSASNMYKFF